MPWLGCGTTALGWGGVGGPGEKVHRDTDVLMSGQPQGRGNLKALELDFAFRTLVLNAPIWGCISRFLILNLPVKAVSEMPAACGGPGPPQWCCVR